MTINKQVVATIDGEERAAVKIQARVRGLLGKDGKKTEEEREGERKRERGREREGEGEEEGETNR